MRISEMPLKDRCDYAEYLEFCVAQNINPTPLNIYTSQVGIIEVATRMFPDLTPTEATDKIIPILSESRNSPTTNTSCGSCGGGEVR